MTAHIPDIPPGTIPIVASSDENYARHMGVMFVSLLENTSAPERCHLFVIDGGITRKTRRTVKHEVEKRKGSIYFLKIDDSAYHEYPMSQHFSVAAYYRISIPELLSDSIKKTIYLDCDLIVKGDIIDLWNYPLNGNPLGAVQDLSNSSSLTSGVPQHKYFNSGVLIIDLAIWRRDGIAEKVHEYLNKYPERIHFPDQCALNGVLFESWKRLPLRWNHQPGIYRPRRRRMKNFSRKEIQEALWNPGIIHYIGRKPWRYPCFHPLAEEYQRYLNQTAWAGQHIQDKKTVRALLAWCLKPKLLRKYLRCMRWKRRYAKHNPPPAK